jgi:heme-degrading monooxygenase HmoA
MTIAVFRSRIRPERADDYYEQAEKMLRLARSLPGFISYKAYTAPDGERVSIHEWESAEELRAWRQHPEHLVMQRIGREQFYEEYTLYVMDAPRESRFTRSGVTEAAIHAR